MFPTCHEIFLNGAAALMLLPCYSVNGIFIVVSLKRLAGFGFVSSKALNNARVAFRTYFQATDEMISPKQGSKFLLIIGQCNTSSS